MYEVMSVPTMETVVVLPHTRLAPRSSRRISKLVSLSELSAHEIFTEPPPRFDNEGLPGVAGGDEGGTLDSTVMVTVSLPESPPESLTLAVIVWVPRLSAEVENDAPVPI